MSDERVPQRLQRPQQGMFGRGPMGNIGMPVQKAKNFTGTLFRLLGYLHPHRTALIIVLVAAALSTVFNVIGPKIMGQATTTIFEGFVLKARGVPGAQIDFQAVGTILFELLALYLVASVFQYVQQYMMAGIAQSTVYAMRRDVEAKFERLPLKFFDARTHGEILSRAVNDMDSVGATLQQNLTMLITSLLTLIGIIVMMLTINVWLTVVVALTLPLSMVLVGAIAKKSKTHFMNQQKALGALNGHVQEMYTGHTIVTAFGHEARSMKAFETLNDAYYGAAWRAQFSSGLIMPVMMFVGNIGYVAVAVVGGWFVTRQTITIGDVQAFIQYARQFSQPIMQLSSLANTIQLTIVSAERVFELLDEPEEPADTPDAQIIESPRGDVHFDRITFSYQPDVPLIEDMDIHVESGKMIAIVGPTGAGKTTLVNLLMRFYDVTGGAITVDGHDIRDLKRGPLRRIFGMVLQDTWLFSGTIRENVAYGLEGATEQQIVKAAKAAQADHFIRTLPENYNTVINWEASNLSQGQKQLLTIARAFLADPAILILDEATSSVDTRTEVLIQKAMAELMKGRTTFVIAHRLSTIRNSDLILMMEHGRIVEQGTHETLLQSGGHYAALYHSQFATDGTARELEPAAS